MHKRIATYQFITSDVERHTHAELAEFACLGGASWVQLRIKNHDEQSWEKIALEVHRICKKYKATLIINDNAQLAKAINADGVHLGKNDLSIKEAREILGEEKIIGGTANAIEDVVKLAKQGVDYIGLGPFRYTTTKKNLSPVLGIEHMTKIIAEAKRVIERTIPIVAIGGIDLRDVQSIVAAGLHGCAISSAVTKSDYKIINSAKFAHELRSITQTAE
ncbi:MAG: thiamine phosphate synthase [Flavobacteriales bacterium]|nr:thiamine phosphate synthase [Flavobacteriales bacterium]